MLVTEVDGDDVVIRYADPEHTAEHISVWAHLHLGDTTMRQVDGGWEFRLTGLPVDRLEYLLDVDGDLRPDPSNPRHTSGPFGDHSWIPLPAYREPAWLDLEPCDGERATLTLSRTGAGRIDVEIWSPADAAAVDPLPLLDQPRRPRDGRLRRPHGVRRRHGRRRGACRRCGWRWCRRPSAQPAVRRQPGVRAGARHPAAAGTRRRGPDLRPPGADGPEPRCAWRRCTRRGRVPGLFAGLFLQSGSFFTAELDPQESGFEFWREVTGFVASVHAAEQAAPDAPPMTLTCGTAEENHANNSPSATTSRPSASRPVGARCATVTPGPAGATPSTLT